MASEIEEERDNLVRHAVQSVRITPTIFEYFNTQYRKRGAKLINSLTILKTLRHLVTEHFYTHIFKVK